MVGINDNLTISFSRLQRLNFVLGKTKKTVGVSHESIAVAIFLLVQVNRTY